MNSSRSDSTTCRTTTSRHLRRIQTETRIRQNAHAAFGSAQFSLVDRRLQLSISGRAQGFGVSKPELTAVGVRSPYDGVAVSAPPGALTGDVSAAYFLPASETKLRVHSGNAFRAPALYERYGGGFSTDPITDRLLFTAFGDPRLEPDRYQTIDAGIDQYLFGGPLLVSATVFYNNVSSLTAFNSSGGIRPDTDPFGRTQGYLNSSGGFSRGVEIAIEARPSEAGCVFREGTRIRDLKPSRTSPCPVSSSYRACSGTWRPLSQPHAGPSA